MIRDRITIFIGFIVFISFALRLWGTIAYDIPETSERVVTISLLYGTGTFSPPATSWYPSAYSLILFPFYTLFFSVGWVLGLFNSAADFAVYYFSNPTPFYLLGRIVTVMAGTLSLVLIYRIAITLCNGPVAILSTILLAFNYLHVKLSQTVTTDVPMTLLLLLTFFFCIKSMKESAFRNLSLAAFFYGLAVAIKFNAVFFFPVLLACHILSLKDAPPKIFRWILDKQLFLIILISLVGFFLFSPQFLMNKEPWEWIWGLVIRGGDQSFTMKASYGSSSAFLLFPLTFLPSSTGVVFSLLVPISIFLLIIKKKREYFLILVFPFFYFFLTGIRAETYPRYWLPIYPFICLSVAILIHEISDRLTKTENRKVGLVFLFTLIIVLSPIHKIINYNYLVSHKDTRELAKAWIEENLASNTKIALEAYSPKLNANISSLKDTLKHSNSNEYMSELDRSAGFGSRSATHGKYALMAAEKNSEKKKFYIYHSFTLSHQPIELYRENGFEYLIVNSYQYNRFMRLPEFSKYGDFYRSLFKGQKLVKEFTPHPSYRPGPTIRIYRIL